MSWINNDGLERFFGTEQAREKIVGEYHFDGGQHCLEISFLYSDLPTVADSTEVIRDNFTLPVGAYIEDVEIHCPTDMDSTNDDMTLSIGTIDTDRTSNGDDNSIVDAATQTELNAGGHNVAGWVGVLVDGTPLTSAKLLTWTVAVHDASAGAGKIRIFYSMPNSR